MSGRLRLDVSHDRYDPRELAKAGRRQTAEERQAATARRQQIEMDQAAAVSAAMTLPRPSSPSRPVERPASSHSGEGVTTSRKQDTPAASGVRGGGASSRAGSSPTASVPARPALTIPPGAEQWRHVPADGWVLSGDEKAKVERLLAEAARREAEQ